MSLLRRLRADAIAWEDGFLSPEACELLLEELEFAYWWPSTVVSLSGAGGIVSGRSDHRRSETTTADWFTRDAAREMARIERRLCRRLQLRRERLEQWQATRYRRGGRFRLHNDAGLFRHEPSGERTTTLLLYLNEPAEGGSTRFPELGLEIAPKQGRLVVWNNLEPDGGLNLSMLHAAAPVRRGVKTTLTSWCRELAVR